MSSGIDFVITWVDGNDPQWQASKRQYTPDADKNDNRSFRYTDWENLQYWFRAVETYAPWVDTIHFVTCGHVPDWLNLSHPKLHHVRHEDYIPGEYLPTFSSNTIELHMHRIPGLSERFVYFNDDVFLTDFVKPEDFFHGSLPCETYALNVLTPLSNTVTSMAFHDVAIINQHFHKRDMVKGNFSKAFAPKYGFTNLLRLLLLTPWKDYTGFFDFHISNNFTKSLMEEVWEKEPEVLTEAASQRFRRWDDVNQWLFRYWSLASGQFYPRSSSFGRCYLITDDNKAMYEAIRKRKYKVLCCNDTGMYTDFETQKAALRQVLSEVFPKKSAFEK